MMKMLIAMAIVIGATLVPSTSFAGCNDVVVQVASGHNRVVLRNVQVVQRFVVADNFRQDIVVVNRNDARRQVVRVVNRRRPVLRVVTAPVRLAVRGARVLVRGNANDPIFRRR